MDAFLSFPSRTDLDLARGGTPEYMRPNAVPYAVVLKGYLSSQQCRDISDALKDIEPYRSSHCNAVTREIHDHPALIEIEGAARGINAACFQYELDDGQHSWLQTYEGKGSAYQRHMDGSPGQMRKLTAVALLSDPDLYVGGNLSFHVTPKLFVAPRTRGTIVIFQSWVEHEVSPLISGSRQTINMGFWGPNFK